MDFQKFWGVNVVFLHLYFILAAMQEPQMVLRYKAPEYRMFYWFVTPSSAVRVSHFFREQWEAGKAHISFDPLSLSNIRCQNRVLDGIIIPLLNGKKLKRRVKTLSIREMLVFMKYLEYFRLDTAVSFGVIKWNLDFQKWGVTNITDYHFAINLLKAAYGHEITLKFGRRIHLEFLQNFTECVLKELPAGTPLYLDLGKASVSQR